MKSQGFNRDRVHEFAMQQAIMDAQLEAERAVLSMPRPEHGGLISLLSDRSAVDPVVYAEIAGPGESGRQDRARLLGTEGFQRALAFYRESLFGKYRARMDDAGL